MKLRFEGHPIIAVFDSGSEASILAQELFNTLAINNMEMLPIPITDAFLISTWGNRTKKIQIQALDPFQMSGGYSEHSCIAALGMIADCILETDFLNKFQVTMSLEGQCMHIKGRFTHRCRAHAAPIPFPCHPMPLKI